MTEFAKAIIYEGPRRLAAKEFPLPRIGDEEMIVEVLLCGVDGSELHMFKGEIAWLNALAPLIFGDEIVGRVSQIGEAAARRRALKVGDIVAIEARWPCASCEYCLHGNYYLCSNNLEGRGYGTISCTPAPHLWGGYATHCYVPPEALIYRVPDGLPIRTALFGCSVLANGVRWTDLAELVAGQRLAVIGPGPQGLACTLAGIAKGVDVIVFGLARDAERLRRAEGFGARVVVLDGDGANAEAEGLTGSFHAVIETAGPVAAKQLALKLVRRAGTIVNASVPSPIEQPVNWLDMLMKEVRLFNPFSHPHAVEPGLALAATLLDQGIDVGELITHTFPLAEAERALRVAGYETGEIPVKVVLAPQE